MSALQESINELAAAIEQGHIMELYAVIERGSGMQRRVSVAELAKAMEGKIQFTQAPAHAADAKARKAAGKHSAVLRPVSAGGGEGKETIRVPAREQPVVRQRVKNASQSAESGRGRSVETGRGQSVESGRGKSVESGCRTPVESGRGKALESGRGKSVESGRGTPVESGRGQSAESGHGKTVESGRGKSVESGRGRSAETGRGKSVESGRGQSVETGRGKSVESGRGKALETGRGQSVETGRGKTVERGRGQSVETGRGTPVESGRGQLVETGRGMSVETGHGTSVETGREQSVKTGPRKSVESRRGKSVETGCGKSVETGRGKSVETGHRKSVEIRVKSVGTGPGKSVENNCVKSGRVKSIETPLKSVETGEQCLSSSESAATLKSAAVTKRSERSLKPPPATQLGEHSLTSRTVTNEQLAKTERAEQRARKSQVNPVIKAIVTSERPKSATEIRPRKLRVHRADTGPIPVKSVDKPGSIVYNKMSQLQELEAKRMAGVMDRFKKKKAGQTPEWSRNGSFLNKPEVGWIHPDPQLCPDAGICYGVRYIGNVEVKESMKSLDFETRTQVAREAINRVAEAAGLITAAKKRKVDKRVLRMLGDSPHMHYAGNNVNLTITTDSINLMVMETGEIIADHPMHVVSFASGGDAETLDFVSYVAKDPALGRACHVLECGGGLAEDVVTTVGQAFELRFKQYLQKQPKAVQVTDRRENPAFESEKWGEEEEYYNDRPGACPPSPGPEGAAPPIPPVPVYKSPCNVPLGTYASVKEQEDDGVYSEAKEPPLIDFSDAKGSQMYDNSKDRAEDGGAREGGDFGLNVYDNRNEAPDADSAATNGFHMEALSHSLAEALTHSVAEDPEESVRSSSSTAGGESSVEPVATAETVAAGDGQSGGGGAAAGEIDLREHPAGASEGPAAPAYEEWYHGRIPRKDAEKLLELDGDFLVRESSNNAAQFVLSGRQSGNVRHLLLVDPEGIVRTKDFIFDSVSHLINYHRQNGLPIITQGSELRLVRPIKTCISAI